MRAEEKEREIRIGIIDDPEWEPDEDFTVELQDIKSRIKLEGDDTRCTVLILDEDKAGNIGFDETQVDVLRKDQIAYIKLVRKDGSDGTISCKVNTICEVNGVPGKKAAVEGKDFVPLHMQEVVFKAGEVNQILEIVMPDCQKHERPSENIEGEEEADTVSFAV
jgi:hypothetical protein